MRLQVSRAPRVIPVRQFLHLRTQSSLRQRTTCDEGTALNPDVKSQRSGSRKSRIPAAPNILRERKAYNRSFVHFIGLRAHVCQAFFY